MRKGKKWLGILAGVMLFAQTASAQMVTVEGYGPDRGSALRDAERLAVENVIGTFIDSKTLVSQGQVALDEIYAKATGFVRNSTVISEGATADGYKVQATVDVDTNGNSALVNQLTAIMRLNDPRIAVVILDHGQRSDWCEAVINERLIDMGFSHVVDANMVLYSIFIIILDSARRNNIRLSILCSNIFDNRYSFFGRFVFFAKKLKS